VTKTTNKVLKSGPDCRVQLADLLTEAGPQRCYWTVAWHEHVPVTQAIQPRITRSRGLQREAAAEMGH